MIAPLDKPAEEMTDQEKLQRIGDATMEPGDDRFKPRLRSLLLSEPAAAEMVYQWVRDRAPLIFDSAR